MEVNFSQNLFSVPWDNEVEENLLDTELADRHCAQVKTRSSTFHVCLDRHSRPLPQRLFEQIL